MEPLACSKDTLTLFLGKETRSSSRAPGFGLKTQSGPNERRGLVPGLGQLPMESRLESGLGRPRGRREGRVREKTTSTPAGFPLAPSAPGQGRSHWPAAPSWAAALRPLAPPEQYMALSAAVRGGAKG
ncbi:unnamed protein product, partial [Gadus morhua 'NCC']